eukprot:Protomagalhaensia_wolfi_Nauph_80__1800@NODE_2122_length_1207_cov_21_413527_g1660_i0_p1_GENE_NODE_2122_length_1207_cov_21_413527_g1660_i0NODE_2122_length_1207_cov_21_413527_g1660_i0_p1_ORF_typecomplete_len281_score52_54_NODE_2122_length_1207_cov_21_413527_g1660_i0152994
MKLLFGVPLLASADVLYTRGEIIDRISAIFEKSKTDLASHFSTIQHQQHDGTHVYSTFKATPYYNLIMSFLKPVPSKEVAKQSVQWAQRGLPATWAALSGNEISRELLDHGWVQQPSGVGLYYNLSDIVLHPFAIDAELPLVNLHQCESVEDFDLFWSVLTRNPLFEEEDAAFTRGLQEEVVNMPLWERRELNKYIALGVDGTPQAIASLVYDGNFVFITDLLPLNEGFDLAVMLKSILIKARRDGSEYAILLELPNVASRFMRYGFRVCGAWDFWRSDY